MNIEIIEPDWKLLATSMYAHLVSIGTAYLFSPSFRCRDELDNFAKNTCDQAMEEWEIAVGVRCYVHDDSAIQNLLRGGK